MSHERTLVDDEPNRVPENVLDGIRDLHEGRTVDVDELIEASVSDPE